MSYPESLYASIVVSELVREDALEVLAAWTPQAGDLLSALQAEMEGLTAYGGCGGEGGGADDIRWVLGAGGRGGGLLACGGCGAGGGGADDIWWVRGWAVHAHMAHTPGQFRPDPPPALMTIGSLTGDESGMRPSPAPPPPPHDHRLPHE